MSAIQLSLHLFFPQSDVFFFFATSRFFFATFQTYCPVGVSICPDGSSFYPLSSSGQGKECIRVGLGFFCVCTYPRKGRVTAEKRTEVGGGFLGKMRPCLGKTHKMGKGALQLGKKTQSSQSATSES